MSASNPALGASAALGCLPRSPALNVRPEPELDAPLATIKHGFRHVVVAVLVLEDRVAVRKSEDLSNVLGVHEILRSYPRRHERERTSLRGPFRPIGLVA